MRRISTQCYQICRARESRLGDTTYSGGTIVACLDPKADTDNFELCPNPDHIYFAVDDLEGRLEVLTHGLGLERLILLSSRNSIFPDLQALANEK